MYRVVLYYLIALDGAGALWAAFGRVQFGILPLLFSVAILLATCIGTNRAFAWAFEAHTNPESSIITALILSLIITPAITVPTAEFLVAASVLATATKYLLAVNKVHVFNPAAMGVVLTALLAGQAASWWVGSAAMLPFVLAGGIVVVTKLQRWTLVSTFLVTATAVTVVLGLQSGVLARDLTGLFIQSPLFFLAAVMLTEPMTLPARLRQQGIYAGLVGMLFPPQVHLGTIFLTPELALVAGNAYAYLVSPRIRINAVLRNRHTTSGPDLADLVFTVDRRVAFEPGQYMEWTLPHMHPDSRGVRRYFTIASAPTEDTLRLGLIIPARASSFKRELMTLSQHGKAAALSASQLGGDFIMPKDPSARLVFIAGGVGITPFRSMIKSLMDRKEKRDIVLLYSEYRKERLSYMRLFEEARQAIGLSIVPFLTHEKTEARDPRYRYGFITAQAIAAEVPDYRERIFYVSGSPPMVSAMKRSLRELHVPRARIRTDYFPGY